MKLIDKVNIQISRSKLWMSYRELIKHLNKGASGFNSKRNRDLRKEVKNFRKENFWKLIFPFSRTDEDIIILSRNIQNLTEKVAEMDPSDSLFYTRRFLWELTKKLAIPALVFYLISGAYNFPYFHKSENSTTTKLAIYDFKEYTHQPVHGDDIFNKVVNDPENKFWSKYLTTIRIHRTQELGKMEPNRWIWSGIYHYIWNHIPYVPGWFDLVPEDDHITGRVSKINDGYKLAVKFSDGILSSGSEIKIKVKDFEALINQPCQQAQLLPLLKINSAANILDVITYFDSTMLQNCVYTDSAYTHIARFVIKKLALPENENPIVRDPLYHFFEDKKQDAPQAYSFICEHFIKNNWIDANLCDEKRKPVTPNPPKTPADRLAKVYQKMLAVLKNHEIKNEPQDTLYITRTNKDMIELYAHYNINTSQLSPKYYRVFSDLKKIVEEELIPYGGEGHACSLGETGLTDFNIQLSRHRVNRLFEHLWNKNYSVKVEAFGAKNPIDSLDVSKNRAASIFFTLAPENSKNDT